MKKLLSLLLISLLLVAFSVSSFTQTPTDVTLKITLPAAQSARLLNAFTKQYGWTAQIPDPANPGQAVPNPVSKRDFAEAVLESFVLQSVEAAEKNEAAEKARREAATDVKAIKLRP
ncbi:MAG TPA: hypothetical protein VGB76_05475 [Pyrinomonadaceae bacterium]|jgi:hypothetical protein